MSLGLHRCVCVAYFKGSNPRTQRLIKYMPDQMKVKRWEITATWVIQLMGTAATNKGQTEESRLIFSL